MKIHRVSGLCVLITLLGAAGRLGADVKMPAIFGDHMVLQQGTKLPVWGWADAGEKVTVTVGSETGSATAGADGKWQVSLAPLPAGTTPVTMTVAGKNKIAYQDVLVGDVWVCSGQSNMEFGLSMAHNKATEIPKADLPLVRLFLVPHKVSLKPLADVSPDPNPKPGNLPAPQWVVCTPNNVVKIGGWGGFSAVGYFFGREIQKTTGQPVGLIGTYWGGTPAQAWTSIEKLQGEPLLKHYADDEAKVVANYPQALAAYPAAQAAYQDASAKWKQSLGLAADAPVDGATLAKAKAAGLPPAPKPPTVPEGGPNVGANLFNGMIAPLIPYAIKGAIWYQGESNAARGAEYATLFPDMISDWRQRWGEGDFPFLFVQLAKYQDPNVGFALVRESQLKTLALPNTGMAVAFDVGDQKNIHPQDKEDVGLRLALAAKHIAYGKDVVYTGPLYDSMKVEGGSIRVSFKQVGGGLTIGTAPWTAPGAQPLPNTTLSGFVVAGEDKVWAPADAKIDGNDVVVSSAQVPKPVAVRYSFLVTDGNLYDKEGLPAPPFRSDDWEVVAPPKPAPAPVAAAAPAPSVAK
jgi:sialate O-acetylesterase